MSRKYTKVDQYENQILTMKIAGKTQREIAEKDGSTATEEKKQKWRQASIPVRKADHARMPSPEILSQSRHMRFNA